MTPSRADVKSLLVWSYNAFAVPVWALASFLPAVGLFEKNAALSTTLGQAFFLVTGLIGVASLWLGLAMLVAPDHRDALPNPLKNKPGVIAIYATFWLAAYAAFQFVV